MPRGRRPTLTGSVRQAEQGAHYVPPTWMTPLAGGAGTTWRRIVTAQTGWCWCAGGCGRSHTPQGKCERHNRKHPHGQASGHCGARLDNGKRLYVVQDVDGTLVATCAPCTDGLKRVHARAVKVRGPQEGPDLLAVLEGTDEPCEVCGGPGARPVRIAGPLSSVEVRYCPDCTAQARQLAQELAGGTWEG